MVNQLVRGVQQGTSTTIERQMQRLAIEAQKHPALSPQRQITLNKLVREVMRSECIARPQINSWPPNIYEDLHNEALQRTLVEICQKIDSYHPEYPFMSWVNYLLKYRFLNVVRDRYSSKTVNLPCLENLDFSTPDSEMDDEIAMLRDFLQADPENLLKDESLRGRPDITFQYLAWERFVEDKTWEVLAAELGISLQTLCSFFNRKLRKLMPYFQKYLQDSLPNAAGD